MPSYGPLTSTLTTTRMSPSWTNANGAGPLTSTRTPYGRPALHLESERPARDRGGSNPSASATVTSRHVAWRAALGAALLGRVSQFGSQLAPLAALLAGQRRVQYSTKSVRLLRWSAIRKVETWKQSSPHL